MVIADNLAAHALGGFQCNFSKVQRFRQFCHCLYRDNKENNPTKAFQLRTVVDYDNNVEDNKSDSSLVSVYGVKGNSCLNSLSNYHVVSGLPPDLAHDLFEGFAIDVVINVVVFYFKQEYFTPQSFNERIVIFDYSEVDKKNVPQPVTVKALTAYKVNQTACEMFNLSRLHPFLIGNLVPYLDPVWNVYCDFLDIVERLYVLIILK